MRFGRMAVVDRAIHGFGIPLLVLSMLGTTAVAGIPGYFFLVRALGPEHSGDALRIYAWIALCTAAAEGVALLAGVFILRRLSARIKRLNEEIRELTRNVLHDLRTPISRISGEAQLLLDGGADARAAAEDMSEACEAMLGVIDANVEITHNYAGDGEPPASDVDFAETLSGAVDLFSAVAEVKGVSLAAAIPQRPLVIHAHRHKLQQLAGNLIDNAIKYTPRGGKVTVSLAKKRGMAVLKVEDTGVGIPKGEQDRIYDRFFRGERGRTPAGSGLGLSLVHAIVSFYGGGIDCISEPGHGTTFVVKLPAPCAA